MTNGLPVGLPLLCRRPIKKMIFFHYPRVSPGAAPLTKKPEDSGYEIGYEIGSLFWVGTSYMVIPDFYHPLLATKRWPKSLKTLGTRLGTKAAAILNLSSKVKVSRTFMFFSDAITAISGRATLYWM